MKTNPALMRAVLALGSLGAVAAMSGSVTTAEDHRPSPEYLKRREERRQKESEEALARDAARVAAANAKRARKALKLAALVGRRGA